MIVLHLCGVSGRPLTPQLSVGWLADTKLDTARRAPDPDTAPSSGVSMLPRTPELCNSEALCSLT